MKTRTHLPPVALPTVPGPTRAPREKKAVALNEVADSLVAKMSPMARRAAAPSALRLPTRASPPRAGQAQAAVRAEQYLESPRGRVVQAQSFAWMQEALGAHPNRASELSVRARLVAEFPEAPHGVAETLVRAMVQGARAVETAERQMVQFRGHVGGTSSILTTKESLRSHHAACRARLQSDLHPKLFVLGRHFLAGFDRRIG